MYRDEILNSIALEYTGYFIEGVEWSEKGIEEFGKRKKGAKVVTHVTMHRVKRVNSAAIWHMEELTSRVVAASGRPEDRFHVGKILLQCFKDTPDLILQIDGGTGKTETYGSVLERSVRCANAFRALGLKCGDVIVLMAPNHLDLVIPFYAALFLGVIISPIDRLLKIRELQDLLIISEPKLVFCQSNRARDVRVALDNINILGAKIVTFDESTENVKNTINFNDFLTTYGDGVDVNNFKPADFDPEETIALLVSTSGTTGLPKQALLTQKSSAIAAPSIWIREIKFPTPTPIAAVVSPVQWLTAIIIIITSPIMKITRLQSCYDVDQEHGQYLIDSYKPTYMIISPTLLTAIINPINGRKPDLSSFETLLIGGSAVPAKLIEELKVGSTAEQDLAPNAEICSVHGMSEANGNLFIWTPDQISSIGKPAPQFMIRLIDVDTQKDILEPRVPGELWAKGPTLFKGYYKNKEATKQAFAEDGWFKTGDVFYRDENYNFYFVERLKLLLKYMNHQISPAEIQNVIRQHPAVMDVAVTGIPDQERGDLPVACVVRRPAYDVTAQEIKDLVRDNLTDSKRLRGGVIFLNSIPMTPTTKIDYRKLKQLALDSVRE